MRRTAQARMLHRSISVSESVNKLSLKAALLFTWMIAHADDQGRLSGTPATVRAVVVPLRDDIPVAEIPALLEEIDRANLIWLYGGEDDEVVERPTIQILNWWDHQSLRDPAPSRFEAHEEWDEDQSSRLRDDQGRYLRRLASHDGDGYGGE